MITEKEYLEAQKIVDAYKEQLRIADVMCSQSDDDAMVDWYMSQQPILTEEESIQEIEKLNKCADFILKSGITPNLDSIY